MLKRARAVARQAPPRGYLFDASDVDVDQLSQRTAAKPCGASGACCRKDVEILGYGWRNFARSYCFAGPDSVHFWSLRAMKGRKYSESFSDVSLLRATRGSPETRSQSLEGEVRNAREKISAQLPHHNVADIGELSALIQQTRTVKDVCRDRT